MKNWKVLFFTFALISTNAQSEIILRCKDEPSFEIFLDKLAIESTYPNISRGYSSEIISMRLQSRHARNPSIFYNLDDHIFLRYGACTLRAQNPARQLALYCGNSSQPIRRYHVIGFIRAQKDGFGNDLPGFTVSGAARERPEHESLHLWLRNGYRNCFIAEI